MLQRRAILSAFQWFTGTLLVCQLQHHRKISASIQTFARTLARFHPHLRQPLASRGSAKTRAGSNHGEPTPLTLASRCGSVGPLLRSRECTTTPDPSGEYDETKGSWPQDDTGFRDPSPCLPPKQTTRPCRRSMRPTTARCTHIRWAGTSERPRGRGFGGGHPPHHAGSAGRQPLPRIRPQRAR